MPKKIEPLKPLQLNKRIAELKATGGSGKIAVGGVEGLYLRVIGNSTYWILFYAAGSRIDNKGRKVTHRTSTALFERRSSYPEVSLELARKRAREIREGLISGVDPKAERHIARLAKEKEKTFEQCATAYIEDKRNEWKNQKHAAQWKSTLETYAFPKIGMLSVAEVDTEAVLRVLRQEVSMKDGGTAQFWNVKNETANRLRGRIESILNWAEVMKYRSEGKNPAMWKGHLDNLLPAPSKVQKVKHHAALPYPQMGTFMLELRKREGLSARALEFAILCASRSNEVRGATWDEIDIPSKTWTIPACRMKAGKEHRVPLSDYTVRLLEALPRMVGTAFVFPAPRGGQLSDMALTAVLRRMDTGSLTQHGFRSTFREWAGETTNHPREVIEHALAHQLADRAEAAYQRGTLWPKRIVLMDDWARYINQL